MQEELKNELKEVGFKVKAESENFLLFKFWWMTANRELRLFELMKKYNYQLSCFNPQVVIEYMFELCSPPK